MTLRMIRATRAGRECLPSRQVRDNARVSKDVDPHDETRAGPAQSVRPGKMVAGHPIGNYELRDVLGEGGMGVVWRAHDPKLDREVAIKVLKRMDAPASLRQRLQREARAMARLKHPNVLTVYDSGTEGGRDFIAMELVEGCSLDVWLERHPMPDDVVAAVLAAGRGLAAAHRAGLVHRDFKPHNILRSNDGRVLVTDFGLARGLGEITESGAEPALDMSISGAEETLDASGSGASVSGARKDSVLDSPLTQTGVLIGTPAYMAPEQFRGAPPDPRTDQFAFCVTAWQMLTGGRPYHGNSLEELRRAAGEGVAHVKTTLLAPPVRAALVRGMDPDPDKRWPSMDELLDELEKATKPKRSRWVVPVAAVAAVLAFVAVGLITRRMSKTDEPVRACQAADVAFGDAWSPAVRAGLWKSLEGKGVSETAFARVTDTFDAWRDDWMRSYDEACRATPPSRARLDCLFSARDNAGAISLVLREGTPQMFEAFDAHGILSNIQVCAGPSPVASPQIPVETRPAILGVMARTFALRMQPDVDAAAQTLVEEARATGWAPLVPMVMLAQGHELLRSGRIEEARDVYERAIPLAKTDARLVANLYLGVLEASLYQLKRIDTSVKPGEVPTEIAVLVDAARATAKAAGNDKMTLASISLLEAHAFGARARWTYDKGLYAEALSSVQEARRLFTELGDLRRAALCAADEAELYLQRADDHALDDAMFVTRSAEEALERAKLPRALRLDALQARIAFARGDFGEARARYARLPAEETPAVDPVRKGIVVDPEGKPVGEATVIAWIGRLDGDPQNLVTDPRAIDGHAVQTASDGTFAISAPQGAGLIAQRGVLRSSPIAVPAGASDQPITLRVVSTNIVSGRVEGRNLGGVEVFTQFAVGDATWRVRTPVHRDGTYAIGGQPEGAAIVGATAAVDDGERTVLAVGRPPRQSQVIEWPHGRAVEVIVRGALTDGARVWIFPGRLGAGSPKTRADAEQLARTATLFATAVPHPIGATATPAGRELYRTGDQHAVLVGNRPQFSFACAAADDKPATTLGCVEVDVTDGQATDFPDGRWGTDTQAIVIEL